MASNFLVFDRIRALVKNSNVYQADRIYSNETQLDRLTGGGNFLDYKMTTSILEQTNLQINRLERYKDYEQMDETGEVSLALDLYADECALCDTENKHTIIIKARNKNLKKELEHLFYKVLTCDNVCRPAIRYLCKYGDIPFEIVLDEKRSAVNHLKFLNIYNFTRLETKQGDLVGFMHMDEQLTNPQYLHPWQVMHLRLTSFENRFHPYGKAIIEGGRKAFKQLRLMEDAALIYRITRAPERRKITIPVGDIPAKEIPEYMQMIARGFKRQRFYNPTSGTFDERYSPMVQEDDYFLPRRSDGSGPDVDTLPGAQNLDQIADIEYFKKKMIAPTKIPFARVGIGEGAGEASEKSLSQSSSEFAKAVQWIQREVATGLTKVAIVHLALRGYKMEDIKGFQLAMTATSAMEELYRMETWNTRVNVMADLKDLGWFPKQWIVTHFTDLSPDELLEIEEMTSQEAESSNAPGGGGSLGGLGGIGGPKPSDSGLPDIADTGAEPGSEQANQGSPGGPTPETAAPEAGAAPKLEGYDYDAESRLINEAKAVDRFSKFKRAFEKWRSTEYTNDYENLLNKNEFDGLTREALDLEIDDVGLDYSHRDDIIVGWGVPAKERSQVVNESIKSIRMAQEEYLNSSEEINERDLPS